MIKTLVSIIIPNYNGEEFIAETLNSILAQSYDNWEAIVIDDGSTDSSIDIVKSYIIKDGRFRLYNRNTKNKGASVCRNIGIENSKGNYLIFLDSDDILSESALEVRVNVMKENSNLDFGVFNMEIFNKTVGDNNSLVNKESVDDDYLGMFLCYDLPWAITCPIWKSSFLKENNIRFDKSFSRLQDPEFHTKILLNHKPKYKYFKNTVSDCYYRLPNSKSKTKSKEYIRKLIDSMELYLVNNINAIENIENIEMVQRLKRQLNIFKIKSYEIILMQNRLLELKPVLIYNKYVYSFLDYKINRYTIISFFLFNRMRLTFVKGLGIYKLWNLLK